MSKLVIFVFVAALAAVSGRIIESTDESITINNIDDNTTAVEKEGRALLEVPIIGITVLKVLKAVWFGMSSIFSIINYKLAALALAVNAIIWLFGSGFPIIAGTAIIIGFCKLSGFCGLSTITYALPDATTKLEYAANVLDLALHKYAKR